MTGRRLTPEDFPPRSALPTMDGGVQLIPGDRLTVVPLRGWRARLLGALARFVTAVGHAIADLGSALARAAARYNQPEPGAGVYVMRAGPEPWQDIAPDWLTNPHGRPEPGCPVCHPHLVTGQETPEQLLTALKLSDEHRRDR